MPLRSRQETSLQSLSKETPLIYVKKHWFIYLLVLPGLVCLILFSYVPMYGLLLAFKDLKMGRGILGSPWVGLKWFIELLSDEYFYKVLYNTIIINVMSFIVGFPFVILLALLLNDVRLSGYKRTMQTFIYLPHFISWVVFGGLVTIILSPSEGPVNLVIEMLGGKPIYFITDSRYFRWVLVLANLIKSAGFSTIVYLAGLAGVNPELYESAMIDGANRFHLNWHINIPRILPSIAVLLILNVAGLFNSNFDQVFNLYNARVYDVGDVISTYLYRTGLLEGKYEMSTALGLIFSIIGLITVIFTNRFIKKMNVTGIL